MLEKRDYNRGLAQGRQEGEKIGIAKGIEQGIEKGIEQKQKEIVMNMYKKNLSINDICEFTNISIEEVEKIINDK